MSERAGKVVLFILLLFYLAHVFHLHCAAEDSFINYRFSKNLAEGLGFIWNPGEAPVEGYTTFLWVVLGALFVWLDLDALLTWQILGTLSGIITIIMVYRFGKQIMGWSNSISLIPCLFLAASGPFATWAGSAMETNFYGLLVFLGCYYFVSYWKTPNSPNAWFSICFLLLAALTRPEGMIVACLLFGLGVLFSIGQMQATLKNFLLPILICGIIGTAYFLTRWNYFGFLLPNTFYLKTGGTFHQYIRGGLYTMWFFVCFVVPLLGIPLMLLFTMAQPNVRFDGLKTILANLKAHSSLATLVLITSIYTIYIIFVGGDYMAMYRFFVPILPLGYLLFGYLCHALFVRLTPSPGQTIAWGLITFGLVATIFQSTSYETSIFPKPIRQHGSYRGVLTERWHVARLSTIGQFFRDYRQNPNESVVTKAIGAISYYASMRILDYHGWVDTYIAHKKTPGIGKGLPGHEKSDPAYMFSKKPTFYMFNRKLTEQPATFPDFGEKLNPLVHREYKLMTAKLTDKINDEEGYFTFLERKDRIGKSSIGKTAVFEVNNANNRI